MVHATTIRSTLLISLLTFSISFTVYLFTLSPTVGLEDAGEFITAIATLGIAHPSGYPLYVVLGKLFTLLVPLGDIAWRVNLFSAFCASLTAALFSLLLVDILSFLFPRQWTEARDSRDEKCLGGFAGMVPPEAESKSESQAVIPTPGESTASFRAATPSACLIATSLSLAFAFSSVFWSQAVIAEVYALNALLVVITWHLLWRYGLHRRASTLYLFAFVYGLSINNHQMMLLLAPIYFLFLLVIEYKSYRTYRTYHLTRYLLAFLLFALGLSFYLFVFFRAGADPLLNWDHPETLKRLWRHFTRQSYNDFSANLWGDLWQLKKVIYVHFFFTDLLAQVTPIGGIFALIGFLVTWFRTRALFLLTFGVFVMNSLAIIFLRKLGYQYEGEQVYRVYYIPAYLIGFLWTGIGARQAWQWMRMRTSSLSFLSLRVKLVIGMVLLLAFPAFLLIKNFYENDKSDVWLVRDWGVSLLQSLAPNAVLLLPTEQPAADSQIFTIAYLTLVERLRPDIAVVDNAYLSSRFYHPVGPDLEEISKLPTHLFRARLLNRVWIYAQKVNRPVYTLYPVGSPRLNGDLMGRGNGLAFRIFPNTETARRASIPPASLALRGLDDNDFFDTSYERDFLSEIHYTRAGFLLEQGRFKVSENAFIEAFNLDTTPLSANALDYMAYRARWLDSGNSNVKSQNSKP